MSKGSELRSHIIDNPLTEEELRARQSHVPELRLRPDMSVTADEATTAKDVLGRLASDENARSLYLHLSEDDGRLDAVVVPVNRYVELVGLALKAANEVEVAADGRLIPRGLDQADVESVDPNASWA
jgi:hypothetical protein